MSVGRFVAMFATFTAVWLTLFSLLPLIVGWSPMVVSSGSMRPVLPEGSIVHVDDTVPLDTLGVGSIITFTGVREHVTTHRVVGVERDGDTTIGFRTKGDANPQADTMVVPVDEVVGVARMVVPFAGLPSHWFATSRWLTLGLFMIVMVCAATVTIETLLLFCVGVRFDSGTAVRLASVVVAIAVVTTGAPATAAAFSSTTDAVGSFTMTSTWLLDSVDADTPIAHWRLGEPPSGSPVTVLTDDFESFAGYTNYGAGAFVGSTAQARSGTSSGLKTANNDPNGGWKLLPSTISGSFSAEVWVYRPSGFGGGSIDRAGLEDGSFNGYTFNVDHNGNTMRIDRRTGGGATGISSAVAFNPPEDAWYRLELIRNGGALTLNAYDGVGTLLATVSTTDSTYTSFDRFVVHGGWNYYVDDIAISQLATVVTAVDRIGTLDGQYSGGVVTGVGDVATGDADTAALFDGIDDMVLIGDSPSINTTARAERTTELWFNADVLTGRQVLYEEGGTGNGLSIYLDGSTLYTTAWSSTWSNPLTVSSPVAPGTRYHIGVTLDAVGARQLELYVDGVSVGTSTKTDSNQWRAHGDDGAIGGLNGGTKFHDGNASGGGYNFDGAIDEVVLYNSALGADRIANHAQAGR
ncbi:MAG: signal peptidase I [Acidimicrobiales bacterium]